MKAITSDLLITSFRSRKDGSLGGSFETPELTVEEKVDWMKLQGVPLAVVVSPKEGEIGERIVKKEIHQYTQSQRIRNKLFRLWEVDPDGMSWEDFYYDRTEKIISWLDAKAK